MAKVQALLLLASTLAWSSAGATSASCIFDTFATSKMLNVSTAGWASKEEPLVTCTIIDPQISNEHGFAFLSETNTEDAVLEIKYVDKPFPPRIADNWKENLSESQQRGLSNHLRTPVRDTDAALIMHVDASRYDKDTSYPYGAPHRFGVCAYGYPKSGRAWTSVSISALRHNSCPWNNAPALLFFEK